MYRNEFQIHQQREKEKQKLEDAETAQVYESYIKTFKGPEKGSSDRAKTFVRGGVFNPEAVAEVAPPEEPTGSDVPPSGKETYTLGKPDSEPRPSHGGIPRKVLSSTSSSSSSSNFSHKRSEEVANVDVIKTSTNLFIRGLSQAVDEERLFRLFSKYGPVASIKIMWPRSQDDKSRIRNTGFLAYMRRDSAEIAITELNGYVLADVELHIEWSKPITIPAYPLALLTDTEAGGLPKLRTLTSWPVTLEQLDSTQTFLSHPPPKPSVVVVAPESKKQRFVIDYMAKVVAAKGGRKFERAVEEAEKENPLYAFLLDKKSSEYVYYRWRVYSYTQGDTEHKWSTAPFQMFVNGPWWLPPPLPSSSSDSEVGGTSKAPLSAVGVGKLGRLLDSLTVSNSKICQVMGFALDHATSAEHVVRIVADSFSVPNIPAPLMVARLFLVSDILYNSSSPAKNAYAYKALFQAALPGIFRCLALFYNSLQGRLTAMHFRDQVERVVSVWEQWALFPSEFIASLRGAFEVKPGPENTSLKRPADFIDSNVPLKK